MKNIVPTDKEMERIDRDKKDYGDPNWQICANCKGSGESYPGSEMSCAWCLGNGEILKEEQSI